MKSKRLFLISALLMAALAAGSAFAGTSIGGGGTSCGGKFLDNMFRKGKYKPKEDPAFEKHVKPVLDRVRACLPFLADDLEMVLSKPWYKVDCRLKVETGSTGYFAAEQMAYQDRVGIFLDENLLGKADDENRASMILHEAIQGIRIEKMRIRGPNDAELEDSAVGVLNDNLQDDLYKTCPSMQDGTRKLLLTSYATRSQLDKWNLLPEKHLASVRDACVKLLSPPDTLSTYWMDHCYFGRPVSACSGLVENLKDFRFLNVQPKDADLQMDARIRIRARIQVRYDGQGFYTDPVSLKSNEEICADLGLPTGYPAVNEQRGNVKSAPAGKETAPSCFDDPECRARDAR